MPRYFFNIYHETEQINLQGEELPDKHAAWKEATVMAGQILQDMDGKLKPGQWWQMEVTDEFLIDCSRSISTRKMNFKSARVEASSATVPTALGNLRHGSGSVIAGPKGQ